MTQWLNRIGIVLSMAGAVLYIFAKIHYFTRIGVLSTDEYLKEHYPYTLGLVAIGGTIWVITRLIDYVERGRTSLDENHSQQPADCVKKICLPPTPKPRRAGDPC